MREITEETAAVLNIERDYRGFASFPTVYRGEGTRGHPADSGRSRGGAAAAGPGQPGQRQGVRVKAPRHCQQGTLLENLTDDAIT